MIKQISRKNSDIEVQTQSSSDHVKHRFQILVDIKNNALIAVDTYVDRGGLFRKHRPDNTYETPIRAFLFVAV